ncbi:MAG TPA: NAD(P)/FAD-dependent oxidoreductase [Ktedonobacterales bacterium]|nr:NAD(P)/FAD-dependent oxidoreductase [Ktedonobacterales bacterium]
MGLLRDPRFGRPMASAPVFDYQSTFKAPAMDRTGRSADGWARDATLRRGRADIVIVGNGIAGCTAAIEARRYAPDATITIVTEQSHPTINTPALKQFGAGHLELGQLLAQPPGVERRLGVGVVHQRVVALDASAHELRLASGQRLAYSRLLLATGSRPVNLSPLPGADFDGVITLHTLGDYLDLRRRLPTTTQAIVVGGGYHAAETALLLRQAGVAVTWLIRGRCVASTHLDVAASDQLIQESQRQGVEARLETELAGVVGRVGVAVGALTTEDEFIPGQLIVAAIGVRPNTDLASGVALPHALAPTQSGGFRVDRRLQTHIARIYAAGALAAAPNPQTRAWETRSQWYFAFKQGRLAGAALAGATIPEGAEVGAMGAFWHATRLGSLRVLTAGAPLLGGRHDTTHEVLTNRSGASYRRLTLREGRLVGYLATGVDLPSGLAIKRIIDEEMNVRDIADQLLGDDFDPQTVFTTRRIISLSANDRRRSGEQWRRSAQASAASGGLRRIS